MDERILRKTIEIIEEREDKNRRKKNLVIYNIEEDETEFERSDKTRQRSMHRFVYK